MVLSKRSKQLLQYVSTIVKKDHLLSSVILSPYLLRAIRGNLFDCSLQGLSPKISLCWKINQSNSNALNPIQDRPFRGCSRIGGKQNGPSFLKSVTHILQKWNLPQLYLWPKIIGIPSRTLWVLLTSAFFSSEISKFCYMRKYKYRLHFSI